MNLPKWVDRNHYPFEPRRIETTAGNLSYVDKGEGPVVLFLHGNPTWSFMYRKPIRTLCEDYRCIAPDYLGFGLSDKPSQWPYRPWNHVENIQFLLNELDIGEFHLVVHDWGGPIGLSVALEEPERLRSLSVINSWMWSMTDRLDMRLFSRFLGSRPGQYLIEEWNVFTDVFMKLGVNQPDSLKNNIHFHYQKPFQGNDPKRGVCQFPVDLLAADEWLHSLWEKRDRLSEVPAFVSWGMKDPAFGKSELNCWMDVLEDPRVDRYSNCSHYLMEDAGDQVSMGLKDFLDQNRESFQGEPNQNNTSINRS